MRINIISYSSKYAQDFYDLNIEWLQTYFYVEDYDEEVLSNPSTYIIDKGGQIFFALIEDKVVGTVALMPTSEDSILELTKMEVLKEQRNKKIDQLLLQHCIDFAKS